MTALKTEFQIRFSNFKGESLTGTLHVNDSASSRAIVMGHCFTCTRHTLILGHCARALAEKGFNVLRFDFSGNGQSQGKFSDSNYSKQIHELKDAAHFLKEQGASWIGLIGHSMGATTILLGANQIPEAAAVCTLAVGSSLLTPDRFLNRIQQNLLHKDQKVLFLSRGRNLEITTEFFKDASQYDLIDQVETLELPMLFIHGDKDEITPCDSSVLLGEKAGKRATVEIIEGADHMFSQPVHRAKVIQKVVTWFNRQSR